MTSGRRKGAKVDSEAREGSRGKVLEFIRRRFPNDSRWLTGNCFYFSLILKERFGGVMLYDVLFGHFVTEIDGEKYDWGGLVEDDGDRHEYVRWDRFDEYDPILKVRVVEGCIE